MKTHGKMRRVLLLSAVICLMLQLPMQVSANQATSYTYAADETATGCGPRMLTCRIRR